MLANVVLYLWLISFVLGVVLVPNDMLVDGVGGVFWVRMFWMWF